jgi:LacI family transcriptional regulator
MARGVEETVTAEGYSLIVCNTFGLPEAELRAHQMLLEKRVDGVLINSTQSGSAPLHRLAREGIPFVLLNRSSAELDVDYARIDYQKGAYFATRHLLELGHRRILQQTAEESHPPARERVLGYCQALAEFGVPFDPDLVIYCGGGHLNSYERVRHAMMHLPRRPTAVAAYNDLWAIPVLKALHDLGLRVPDDVAVTGHHDLELASFFSPPLTSVAQPIYEMGCRGADILLRKIGWPAEKPWTLERVVLDAQLVVRESSGTLVPVVAATT